MRYYWRNIKKTDIFVSPWAIWTAINTAKPDHRGYEFHLLARCHGGIVTDATEATWRCKASDSSISLTRFIYRTYRNCQDGDMKKGKMSWIEAARRNERWTELKAVKTRIKANIKRYKVNSCETENSTENDTYICLGAGYLRNASKTSLKRKKLH